MPAKKKKPVKQPLTSPSKKTPRLQTIDNPEKLNARQRCFVDEYLKTPNNPIGAYYRAGYSAKNDEAACTRVNELLSNPKVGKAIRVREAAVRKRTEITKDFLIEHLVLNLKRSLQRKKVVDHKGNFLGEYQYCGSVANKSIELLGRLIGEFDSRIKVDHVHSGEVTTTHNVKIADLGLPAETLRTLLEAARQKQMIVDGSVKGDEK